MCILVPLLTYQLCHLGLVTDTLCASISSQVRQDNNATFLKRLKESRGSAQAWLGGEAIKAAGAVKQPVFLSLETWVSVCRMLGKDADGERVTI